MNKPLPRGQMLSRVFNSRSGCAHCRRSACFAAKLPSLKLKTRRRQLWGSLPVGIALPQLNAVFCCNLLSERLQNSHKNRQGRELDRSWLRYVPPLEKKYVESDSTVRKELLSRINWIYCWRSFSKTHEHYNYLQLTHLI